MHLGVLLTIFLPLLCFASSIDFKDTLLGVNTVTRDDSFPREKLWLIHQFKTTWTVTAGSQTVTEKQEPDWAMTNSGLISPQRERLLVSKSKWMDCIRVQKSSDTTLPQTQAKNAVRQYFRIIAHQKCQEALQCQEQKEKTTFNVHIFYSGWCQ